ncbi:MAG: DNA repair protein RecO [Verrucomicrobia bacterium]|nr:DNA repair protein RecO [Verrucomicrobiota bacterium]
MQEEKTEGIVLKAMDYKERHRIITLFTPQGLTSLIVRGISRKNTRLLSLTSPFCHGEYLYRRGRSELLGFRDGSVLDDNLALRKNLKSLQVAGALANAILTSQMPDKPAPALFVLYKSYHKQIPHFADPEVLLASFYLKLLKHEGLLTITPHCASCESPSALQIHEGESLCSRHEAAGGFRFSPAEWDLLLLLDGAQQFSSLKEICVPSPLSHKIAALFLSRISH